MATNRILVKEVTARIYLDVDIDVETQQEPEKAILLHLHAQGIVIEIPELTTIGLELGK